jgi:UDP-2-acetamido-2-deoxy-ribo-hexuluronate aminotransferase
MKDFFGIRRQNLIIKKKIKKKINNLFKHNQYILGPEVQLLEKKLSAFVGSKYCITTSSGTDALLISLICLGIGQEDEVIVPNLSYIASAEVIKRVGATPIFVDIKESDFNINEDLIEKKISKKTKAIIAVSLFGQTPNFKKINLIAKKFKIFVIEDAAQSFAAKNHGKMSCNLSDIGCTSFFPTKILGCYGDGGAIFTNKKKIYEKCMKLRIHGQSKKYVYDLEGLNARLDTIQAIVLLEKLKILKKEIRLRSKKFIRYKNFLKKIQQIKLPEINKNNKPSFSIFTIIVKKRNMLFKYLRSKNIPVAIYYPKTLNSQKIFARTKKNDCPISENLTSKIMSIPFSPYIKDEEMKKISKEISNFYSN